jgi:pectinesterase
MTVTPATLRRFVLSNGLANPTATGSLTTAFAPYSSVGMAFSTTATGAGGSTNTPGGPRRPFYVQVAITNTGTTDLRADSLVFTASTANSANGRVALSYSTTGFATDSVDFVGGKGPAGALPAINNGSFGAATSTQAALAPIILPQYVATAGDAASTFRMAFVSGGTGLTVAAGRTLTVRMYFRVGSDTEGRYFLLRNVILKSRQALTSSNRLAVNTSLSVYPNPAQNRLNVAHAAGRAGQVLVYSATGAKIAAYATQPGTTETAIELSALAKGLYLVEYTDGTVRSTARIVKE